MPPTLRSNGKPKSSGETEKENNDREKEASVATKKLSDILGKRQRIDESMVYLVPMDKDHEKASWTMLRTTFGPFGSSL